MQTEVFSQQPNDSISLCSSCNYYMKTLEQQKIHYKSEFHRYNMKRKIVNLPPVSLEIFNSRKETTKNVSQNKMNQFEKQQQTWYCQICRKGFGCQSIYDQHMQSKKHSETEKLKQQKQETKKEIIKSKEPNKLITTLQDPNICLFCNKASTDLEKNFDHMQKQHGFFISDKEYVTDLPALLKYFAEKIQIGLLCLLCENKKTKAFKSPEAVQKHMMDKGHCFMQTDDFEEYEEFYDFTSKYKEYMQDDVSEKDYEIQIESDNEKQEEEWEDVEDQEEEKKEGSEEKNKFRSLLENKKKKAKKIIKIKKAKLLPSGELLLPNKKLLGHRTYNIYYKQYFRSLYKEKEQFLARLLQYRSDLSLVKYQGNALALMLSKKFYYQKHEKFVVSSEIRECKRLQAKINANSNNQKHFRKQMLV